MMRPHALNRQRGRRAKVPAGPRDSSRLSDCHGMARGRLGQRGNLRHSPTKKQPTMVFCRPRPGFAAWIEGPGQKPIVFVTSVILSYDARRSHALVRCQQIRIAPCDLSHTDHPTLMISCTGRVSPQAPDLSAAFPNQAATRNCRGECPWTSKLFQEAAMTIYSPSFSQNIPEAVQRKRSGPQRFLDALMEGRRRKATAAIAEYLRSHSHSLNEELRHELERRSMDR
jgi:hypothetical protein